VQQLPYLPLNLDYSKVPVELPRDKYLEVMNLKTGLLRYEGWARYPNQLVYNLEIDKIKSNVPFINRLKRWNYFYIMTEEYLVTMAHVDLGLVEAAYVNIKNIKDLSQPMVEIKVEDHLKTHLTFDYEKDGNSVYTSFNHADLNSTFVSGKHGTTTKIDIKGQTSDGLIEGNFIANATGNDGI
jgi:hypothetical protein